MLQLKRLSEETAKQPSDSRLRKNKIQNVLLWVTGMSTCSEPGLLLSFSQVAVGAEVGVSRRRVGRLGPTFPLDEVGDPALSQGGGLGHMVPHCLRDTCKHTETEREREGGKGSEFRARNSKSECTNGESSKR